MGRHLDVSMDPTCPIRPRINVAGCRNMCRAGDYSGLVDPVHASAHLLAPGLRVDIAEDVFGLLLQPVRARGVVVEAGEAGERTEDLGFEQSQPEVLRDAQ